MTSLDQQTTDPNPAPKGRALAITALIVAIVALLLCWIPIVNNVVFFLGIIGLALAIPAFLRARKGRALGKGMATAAVAISVLSLVGVLATQAFYVSVLNDVEDAVVDAGDGKVTKTGDDKEAEAQADVLDIGQGIAIGDEYEVKVKKLDLNATARILKVNEFNEKPKGQYVMATLAVTYTGNEEGDPWIDLTAKLAGSDSRNYDTSTCMAVTPRPAVDVPTLSHGGNATYNVCFDVPKKALENPKIFIEESMSFEETRQYWASS